MVLNGDMCDEKDNVQRTKVIGINWQGRRKGKGGEREREPCRKGFGKGREKTVNT